VATHLLEVALHEGLVTLHRLVEGGDRHVETLIFPALEDPSGSLVADGLDRAEMAIRDGDSRLVVLDGAHRDTESIRELALREPASPACLGDSPADCVSLVEVHGCCIHEGSFAFHA